MVIFLCRDEFNSILCGVYDAWMSRLGHENVKLQLEGRGNLEMFSTYRQVEESDDKCNKVITAIKTKISSQVYEYVYKAALCEDQQKADKIYRFLIYGFHYGKKVVDMLQIDSVFQVFKLCRFIGNEAHFHVEFLRFSQMEQGILLSRIGPKNDVLSLIAPHFADRLSGENWIIYDENRKKAALHGADKGWLIADMDTAEWTKQLEKGTDEEEYRKLWKAFHKSIAIESRVNPTCQRNHLPLRYRPYMTEFRGGHDW